MFDSVNEKLKTAEYFLNQLKHLEKDLGSLDLKELLFLTKMNLDGFLFEVIGAKDVFLQEINKVFQLGFKSAEITIEKLLNSSLSNLVKEAIKPIKILLSDTSSWFWRLNNYRNVTAHRALFIESGLSMKLREGATFHGGEEVELNLKNGYIKKKKDNSQIPLSLRLMLMLDTEDPSRGPYPQEIIPYCEESLKKMREFLEQLYKKIEIK